MLSGKALLGDARLLAPKLMAMARLVKNNTIRVCTGLGARHTHLKKENTYSSKVGHTFLLCTLKAEAEDLCEFQANFSHRTSSRSVRAP